MDLIESRKRFGSHLSLDRIKKVCAKLGDPQNRLKFIHIAGTNGKGSVAAMLGAVLQKAGFKVGLFTSPYLEHYEERFQVNGTPIGAERLKSVVSTVDENIREIEAKEPQLGAVTEFELATAVGFLYFFQEQVDIVVLETGLGGRLDATNVVTPELSIITSLGHDHLDRLGTSLEQIAGEKGGIIKTGVPVISGVLPGKGEKVLQTLAKQRQAPWLSTGSVAWQPQGWGLEGGNLIFPGWGPIQVSLIGSHQLRNAATALLALEELNRQGWDIPLAAVQKGMEETSWPGRMEVVSRKPFVLLDGGHNPEGLAALAADLAVLQEQLHLEKFTFVFGVLHTKEPRLMEALIPLARRFVFTAAESGRLAALNPSILVDYAQARGIQAEGFADAADAFRAALENPPVCVCGSLYLVGTIKRYLRSRSLII